MKQSEAEDLLSCLPGGRTLFTYGKDWYAVSLLKMALRRSAAEQLRQSGFRNLFEKPRLRAWLGTLGKKSFTAEDLDLLCPDDAETYRLSASLFEGWEQTSRKGKDAWNIVLQLNLNGHDASLMEKHFPDRSRDPFEWAGHPVHGGRHRTLAWARIDLDWNRGQALIEEIQNDRLREVRSAVERIRREKQSRIRIWGEEMDSAFVLNYWDQRLRVSRQCWDEAMLCAAIQFIVGELGIRKIFYHSPVSGQRLKNYGRYRSAPVSVYTDLPRRFCFEHTTELPGFLKVPKRHRKDLWMHRLVF